MAPAQSMPLGLHRNTRLQLWEIGGKSEWAAGYTLQLDVPTPSCHLLSRSLASQRLTDVANPVKAPPSRNQDKVQFLSICLAISCLIGGVGVELCPVITGPLGARLGPFLLFRMQTIIRGSAALPKKKHFAVSPRPHFRRPN